MDKHDIYKNEKLNFVSNLNGSTFIEIFNLISIFPLINFISLLFKLFILYLYNFKFDYFSHYWKSFLIEYTLCILPLILVCTLLNEWIYLLVFGMMLMVLVVYKNLKGNAVDDKSEIDKSENWVSSNTVLSKQLSLDEKILKLTVSTFRTWLYLLTCVSILAVDFRIFPRKLAKTETYGVSLMDLGVGMFIVCHSMKFFRNKDRETSMDFCYNFLMLFGVFRLISVKSSGYVEHESEYGRHWNFFFTIVFVKLGARILQILYRDSSVKSFLIGILISVGYQYLLTSKRLSLYLLSKKRNENSLFDLNREGIFSCVGYLAIYLISQSIFIIFNNQTTKRKGEELKNPFVNNLKIVGYSTLFTLFSWITFEYSRHNIENASRRLCNFSFIFFIITITLALFMFFMVTIILISKRLLSIIELNSKKNESNNRPEINLILFKQLKNVFLFVEIIDSKFIGLILFLVSNLFTGGVNLLINTLKVSDWLALAIISIYSLASLAISLVYYKINSKPV